MGLPEDAFVFCSFNQAFKIEPVMFGAWMRIMQKIPAGVLWLLKKSDTQVRNLKREAVARGVEPHRLVFGEKMPKNGHLARHRLADLVLDTRIYNGHTTTSDALWAGVPVLALRGNHFASRVAASILMAGGLPELIAHDLDAYEEMAVRLARNPDQLGAMRRRLGKNRLNLPLFDTPKFVRELEYAYGEMWRLYRGGEKPRTITNIKKQKTNNK